MQNNKQWKVTDIVFLHNVTDCEVDTNVAKQNYQDSL